MAKRRPSAALDIANERASIGEYEAFWADFRKGDGYEEMRLVDLGHGNYQRSLPRDWDPLDVWNYAVREGIHGPKNPRTGEVKNISPVQFVRDTMGLSTEQARRLEYMANQASFERGVKKATLADPTGKVMTKASRRENVTDTNANLFVQARELLSDHFRKPLLLEQGQRAVVFARRDGIGQPESVRNLSGLGRMRHDPRLPKFMGSARGRTGAAVAGEDLISEDFSTAAPGGRIDVVVRLSRRPGPPPMKFPPPPPPTPPGGKPPKKPRPPKPPKPPRLKPASKKPAIRKKAKATDALLAMREKVANQLAEIDRLLLEQQRKGL